MFTCGYYATHFWQDRWDIDHKRNRIQFDLSDSLTFGINLMSLVDSAAISNQLVYQVILAQWH